MTVNLRSSTTEGSTTTSFSVTKPFGSLTTDLLLAIHFGGSDNTDAAMTAPVGFTQVGSTWSDPNNSLIKVWTAPGTTADPYTFGGAGSGQCGVMALENADPTAPINVFPVFNAGESIDVQIAPSVVPTVAPGRLICGWCGFQSFSSQGYTAPNNMALNVNSNANLQATPFIAGIANSAVLAGAAFRTTGTRTALPIGPPAGRYAAITLVIV